METVEHHMNPIEQLSVMFGWLSVYNKLHKTNKTSLTPVILRTPSILAKAKYRTPSPTTLCMTVPSRGLERKTYTTRTK